MVGGYKWRRIAPAFVALPGVELLRLVNNNFGKLVDDVGEKHGAGFGWRPFAGVRSGPGRKLLDGSG